MRIPRVGDWPLATRIAALCIGVAAALAIGLTILGYAQARHGLQEQAEAALSADARHVTGTVDAWHTQELANIQMVAGFPATGRLLADSPAAAPTDVAAAQDLVNALASVRTGAVSLVDPQGNVVLSSNPAARSLNVAQRDYFQEAIKGTPYISGVTISLASGLPVLFHAVPVFDARRQVSGLVVSAAALDPVQQAVDAARDRVGPGARGVLIGPQGVVIANSVDQSWQLRPLVPLRPDVRDALVRSGQWGSNTPPEPLGQSGLAPAIGVRERTRFPWEWGGTTYQALAMPLSTTNWTYATALPVSTFEAPAQTFLRQAAIAAGLALLPAALLAMLFARGINRTVQQVTSAATGLAAGDLRQTVVVESRDELGQMAAAVRAMLTRLREMTTELQEAAHNLAALSAEMQATVAQHSSSANQQASGIAETTATIEELKASAAQVADTTATFSETTQRASHVASDGVTAVQEAVEGMADIHERVHSIADTILSLSEQNEQIGQIIATVSDIADQSNLLALNAAIEASRAGEHGRGFSVVATEIRSLAEQSKAATSQVRTLLGDIQRATHVAVLATEQGTHGVEEGTQRIQRAGQTITELADMIQHGEQSAVQIAAAARQQSVAMDQIASAMSDINQATTQTLQAPRETERAATDLTDLATRLNQLIAQYKL